MYITQVHNFTGVYYTSHRCIFSQVYITHPLKKKKGLWEAWIIDQLTTHLFSSKGHNSGHSSCVLFFCKYIVSMYFKKPSPTLYHNKSLVWSEQQQHCTHTLYTVADCMCVHVCAQVDINIILMNKLNYFTNHLVLSYLLMIQCIRIKALLFLHTGRFHWFWCSIFAMSSDRWNLWKI